ncbi:hypothetical protein C0J52_27305 [Blattella germanica]|nr:hypothetical protein C0J52_27305 [Blattella germanica]
MTHDDASAAQVGQRVECNGFYGTVQYMGEVPPTIGVWLGIDWDDPTRGKHDGTHEGVKYFSTRHATSGSFARMGKVNFGKSCPSAIRNRYGEVKDDETAGINKENLALLQHEISARFIEVVGFDKVNKKQRHATSGSFARMGKVNFGKSCPSAIRNRYGEVKDDETAGINKENLALLQHEISARFIEVVGFDKVNKKQSLEYLNASNIGVREVNFPVNQPEEKTRLFPALKQLHLSENDIHSVSKNFLFLGI